MDRHNSDNGAGSNRGTTYQGRTTFAGDRGRGAALVAALAGTAVAGTDATTSAINKKKVKKIATKQANKAIDAALPVGSEGIADGAITGGKLADGAVGRGKIGSRAIGPSALGDIVVRRGQSPLNDGSNAIPDASCLPGERLISGGGTTNRSIAPDISMNSSTPENGDGTGVQEGEPISPPGRWSVEFVNEPEELVIRSRSRSRSA